MKDTMKSPLLLLFLHGITAVYASHITITKQPVSTAPLVVGGTAVFSCEAVSFPAPTITWFRVESGSVEVQLLNDGVNIIIASVGTGNTTSSDLSVLVQGTEDFAQYFCVIDNGFYVESSSTVDLVQADGDAEVVFKIDLTTGAYEIAPNSGITWRNIPGTNGNNCSLQGVLRIVFPEPSKGVQRRRFQFELYFASDARGWNFHIGDTRGDGYGGGHGNAAEVHNINRDWYVYGNSLPGYQDYTSENVPFLVDHLSNAITDHVTVTIGDELVEFDNHNGTQLHYNSEYLFALSGQPTSGRINYKIFFGMNRVITSTSRSGTGLCRVVIKALGSTSGRGGLGGLSTFGIILTAIIVACFVLPCISKCLQYSSKHWEDRERNSVYRCLVWPYRTCKQHRSNSSLPSRSSRNTRTAGGTAVVLSYSRRTAATHTSDRVTTTRGTAATHTSDRVTTTRGTAATHTSDRVTTTIGTAAAHTSETTTDRSRRPCSASELKHHKQERPKFISEAPPSYQVASHFPVADPTDLPPPYPSPPEPAEPGHPTTDFPPPYPGPPKPVEAGHPTPPEAYRHPTVVSVELPLDLLPPDEQQSS